MKRELWVVEWKSKQMKHWRRSGNWSASQREAERWIEATSPGWREYRIVRYVPAKER